MSAEEETRRRLARLSCFILCLLALACLVLLLTLGMLAS